MSKQGPDRDSYSPDAQHFNVKCTDAKIVFNRVTARELKELPAATVESVWSIEEKRELTREEIKQLCAGAKWALTRLAS